jgi:hypothetical protein
LTPDAPGIYGITLAVEDSYGALSTLDQAVVTVASPSLTVNDVAVSEGSGHAAFTVSLSGPSPTVVTVEYATADGTAQAGGDYTATSGTLTIPVGDTIATVSVPITDDALYEGDETFSLNLSNATNATISDSEGTGTILNDDLTPDLRCFGFQPPVASGSVTARGNRALPFKAQLYDADGYLITDSDIAAPPVIQVLFDSGGGGDPVDVTDDALPAGMGSDGNQFEFDLLDESWHFNLKTKDYNAVGTYTVTMVTGDASEYIIDPTCEAVFVRQ